MLKSLFLFKCSVVYSAIIFSLCSQPCVLYSLDSQVIVNFFDTSSTCVSCTRAHCLREYAIEIVLFCVCHTILCFMHKPLLIVFMSYSKQSSKFCFIIWQMRNENMNSLSICICICILGWNFNVPNCELILICTIELTMTYKMKTKKKIFFFWTNEQNEHHRVATEYLTKLLGCTRKFN